MGQEGKFLSHLEAKYALLTLGDALTELQKFEETRKKNEQAGNPSAATISEPEKQALAAVRTIQGLFAVEVPETVRQRFHLVLPLSFSNYKDWHAHASRVRYYSSLPPPVEIH